MARLGLDDSWEQALARGYELLQVLGKGRCGTVVAAQWAETGQAVAIKKVDVQSSHKYSVVRMLRELSIMEYLQMAEEPEGEQPMFVRLLDVFAAESDLESERVNSVFLVMERKARSLQETIDHDDIDDEQLKTILYQLLQSLNYLHQSNIVHRDIKPSNILLGERSSVICDFGLARTLPESLQGKHGGNSIRVRDYELKKLEEKKSTWTEDQEKSRIGRRVERFNEGSVRERNCLSPHVQTR